MNMSILASTLSTNESYTQMKSSLIILAIICGALLLFSIVFTLLATLLKWSQEERKTEWIILTAMYAATLIALICTLICFYRYTIIGNDLKLQIQQETTVATIETEAPTTAPTEAPTTAPTEAPDPTFTPSYTDSSNPENWGIKWDISSNGEIVESIPSTGISFGNPEEYFALPGIATFRGNNYRNGPTYGTVNVTENALAKAWGRNIGALNGWTGSGWTGQPLIVQWDQETKNIMNMFQEKKEKEGLVEVIYATLDGNIYFYDLDDGSYTRNPISVGMNFKGAGALDPRGYPILYVGSGDFFGNKSPRMYIISLIDGTILQGKDGYDGFALRAGWSAFDSSPLVDAETDTLIWPGENGVLYTMKLNTQYDKQAGTLSIEPSDVIKARYNTKRSGSTYWLGYEPSCVIVDRYLYISENGGMFFCIDLDTMQLVWAQDTRDDSNSTPVFEWAGLDGGYIYTAPSLHWTASGGYGYICVYKLDARTGEIVWETKFECGTVKDVSGGVQASPILGKPGTELEGLVIYPIARTPSIWEGKLVAIDTETGEIAWETAMTNYAWSSPVAVYGDDGSARIIACDSVGHMMMLDSKGKVLTTINLGSNIEASPAVFNDTLVIGTRGCQVYAFKIK